jgi:hypothetical protein
VKKRVRILAAMTLVAGTLSVGAVSEAAAAPSCVGVFVTEFGPPPPHSGLEVAFVAHLPKEQCFIP